MVVSVPFVSGNGGRDVILFFKWLYKALFILISAVRQSKKIEVIFHAFLPDSV